jgi:Cyanobacterial TRADD-N associated 2-Transmembrane domain
VTEDLCPLWWMFAIRGFVSVAFAFVCYLLSSATASQVLRPLGYLYLLVFFGSYVGMSGIVLLIGAIYAFDLKLVHRRSLFFNAILDLVIGPSFLLTFGFGLSFSFIVLLFGLDAAAFGVVFVTIAVQARKRQRASYVLGLAGFWSVLAGAYLMLFRSLSPGKLTLAGSIYTGTFGLLLLLLAIDLRTAHRNLS